MSVHFLVCPLDKMLERDLASSHHKLTVYPKAEGNLRTKLLKPLYYTAGLIRIGAGENQQKFVSAKSASPIRRPQARSQDSTKLPNHFVAP